MVRVLLATLLVLLPASVFAQAITPTEQARIDQLVATTLRETGVPSASIAVVRDGRLVFARAYGKQCERCGGADANQPYPIASISKQFTAAALLLLEDEGKLSLDDPIANYLSGITAGDRITIRQLLSHVSGLQDYWPQDYRFTAMAKPITPQGIIDRWAKKPLDFAPGTQWQYSNTGYVVAGLIAEKVSGEPLLSFIQRRILLPLGIHAMDMDLVAGGSYPQGYGRHALGPVRPEPPSARGWLFAAGGLAMSAADLARWDVARLDRALLPADDWTAQETPAVLTDGTSSGYGLGVFVGTRDGRRYVEHDGGAVGFLLENTVFPDERAAVVVLTNSGTSDAFLRIARGIAAVALPPPPASVADQSALVQARVVFDQLRRGSLDRRRLTANASDYFTPVVLGDYRASLAPLGAPARFEQQRPALLRGGFVNRVYKVVAGGRTLAVSTYTEPGPNGRLEQFLVAPVQ